jgi:cytochrome bd ubiquinol oxidase subunit II
VGTLATYALRPRMFSNFHSAPWGLVFPALVVAGLAGIGWFNRRQRDQPAFLSSCAFLLGLLASAAFGLYPNVLPAVNPAYSLTIENASAGHYGLVVGLIWWIIGMLLAAAYFILTYRLFRGKVKVAGGAGY